MHQCRLNTQLHDSRTFSQPFSSRRCPLETDVREALKHFQMLIWKGWTNTVTRMFTSDHISGFPSMSLCKNIVYQTKIRYLNELKLKLTDVIATIDEALLQQTWQEIQYCLHVLCVTNVACIRFKKMKTAEYNRTKMIKTVYQVPMCFYLFRLYGHCVYHPSDLGARNSQLLQTSIGGVLHLHSFSKRAGFSQFICTNNIFET